MTDTEKWFWIMEWCRLHRLAPGADGVWTMAEEEYNKHLQTLNNV